MSNSDRRTALIEGGLNLIPHIGGALATAYTYKRDKKKTERIETFMVEVNKTIQELQKQGQANLVMDNHDEDYLISLIDKIFERVEVEVHNEKKRYFKHFFLNTIFIPTHQETYDKKTMFLDALSNLTFLECEMLMLLYPRNSPLPVKNIKTSVSNDPHFVLSLTNRLRNYGFISKTTNNITILEDNAFNELVAITELGKEFTSYCLETS